MWHGLASLVTCALYHSGDADDCADGRLCAKQSIRTKARSGNGDLYDTLRAYIDCERSLSRTAAALFTHRNTVLYRIRKCQDLLGGDLDSAEKRLYIRISMQALELCGEENEKKNG